jgi:hypothetical protein
MGGPAGSGATGSVPQAVSKTAASRRAERRVGVEDTFLMRARDDMMDFPVAEDGGGLIVERGIG